MELISEVLDKDDWVWTEVECIHAGLVAHLAPEAAMLPVTVLDETGAGDLFHVAAGILFAIDQGAHIINLSVGSPHESETFAYVMDVAETSDALMVAAAGNDDVDEPALYPAADPRALAVAATNADDLKSAFSNYGMHIDLSAPGVQIVSALPGNIYGIADGTSLSTAIASAAAALLRSDDSQKDVHATIDMLKSAALNIDQLNPSFAGLLGAGRVRISDVLDSKPSPDLNSDGVVDVFDLIELINQWGPCGDPADCPADLSGPDGEPDGIVDVFDLIELINNWGPYS